MVGTILMQTEVTGTRLVYRVIENGAEVWRREVPFMRDGRQRVAAAREQDRVAMALAAERRGEA
jgi:hypothetical protein